MEAASFATESEHRWLQFLSARIAMLVGTDAEEAGCIASDRLSLKSMPSVALRKAGKTHESQVWGALESRLLQ